MPSQETNVVQARQERSFWSRTQFPLVFFYAATCHKTQGLTLPAAVVHCSQEFVSGLTYVSVTRVRHDNNIQVCNFQERFLLRPLQDAVNISKPKAEGDVPIDNFCCCCSQVLPKDYFLVTDDGLEDEDVSYNDDDHLDDHVPGNADGMVQSYFERDEDEVVLDLANALLIMETEMSQVNPPDDISDRVILNEIRPLNPDDPISSRELAFAMFVKVTWFRLFQVVEDFLVENDGDLFISRQEFTSAVNALYTKVICSAGHWSDQRALFQTGKLSFAYRCIGSFVCIHLYKKCVHDLAARVIAQMEMR